jgi:hypothetical protein
MSFHSQPTTSSMVSRYGYGSIDVRATYAHLPCQRFWTWLTGKALPSGPPRPPRGTLYPSVTAFVLETLKSYALLAAALALGVCNNNLLIQAACIVVVMNRTRKLLHQFHYTSHGAALANMKVARRLATFFLSLPIMHTTWDEYLKIHVRNHHGMRMLCTDDDPDQKFVVAHGFRRIMSERAFWLAVLLPAFAPHHIAANIWFRVRQNFIVPPLSESLPRTLYWLALFTIVTVLDGWAKFSVFFLFPLFILTQYSSYLQHVTEHLWFAERPAGWTIKQHVASLTWGRFLGRPYPHRNPNEPRIQHTVHLLTWWLKIFLFDLPTRVFFFMQDLSSHDFHHRIPGVCFRVIAQERANWEQQPGQWGPMTETWSMWESLLVLRDHLVHGCREPFHWPAPMIADGTKASSPISS